MFWLVDRPLRRSFPRFEKRCCGAATLQRLESNQFSKMELFHFNSVWVNMDSCLIRWHKPWFWGLCNWTSVWPSGFTHRPGPPFRFHHVLLGDMYLELLPGAPRTLKRRTGWMFSELYHESMFILGYIRFIVYSYKLFILHVNVCMYTCYKTGLSCFYLYHPSIPLCSCLHLFEAPHPEHCVVMFRCRVRRRSKSWIVK